MNLLDMKKKVKQSIESLVIKIIENLINRWPHPRLNQCLNNFKKNKSLQKLNENLTTLPYHKKAFYALINEFNSWKKAYKDLKQKQTELIGIGIQQFLMSFQLLIKVIMKTVQMTDDMKNVYEEIQKSYNVQINKGRLKYKWSKQFIQEWRKIKQSYLLEEMERIEKNLSYKSRKLLQPKLQLEQLIVFKRKKYQKQTCSDYIEQELKINNKITLILLIAHRILEIKTQRKNQILNITKSRNRSPSLKVVRKEQKSQSSILLTGGIFSLRNQIQSSSLNI